MPVISQHLPPNKLLSLASDRETISQINQVAGLAYFGGRLPSYRRILGLFEQTHSGDFAELQLALDSGDYGSAQRIAHSLKSVSLTLGAESLSKLAQSVEKRIREVKIDAELSAEIVSMTEAFKLVCSEIAAMQIDINAPALIDVDPQFFHALVAKFELQLDNQDSHAVETWRTLEPLLEEAVGVDVVEQLAQQMQRPLDLIAAQATLRKIVLDSPGIKS